MNLNLRAGLRNTHGREIDVTIAVTVSHVVTLTLDAGQRLGGQALSKAILENLIDRIKVGMDGATPDPTGRTDEIERVRVVEAYYHESNDQGSVKVSAEAEVEKLSSWSPADSAAAEAQGWDIFDAGGDRGLEIERIDLPEDGSDATFGSDDAALAFVARRAIAKDPLALRALRHLTELRCAGPLNDAILEDLQRPSV